MKLENLIFDIKQGLSDAKRLKYVLENLWGWRKTLRWIYQQFEAIDGYDSIFIRYVKLMTAMKETSFKDFEMIRFAIDFYLDNHQVKGFPITVNPLLDLLNKMEVNLLQVKQLAKV